ncbi:hypothetical protein BT96DRAFT_974860 [Gymnopus androsaceus JB14]|uniref:Uncharacterized protein n=1 Tax=Gymnopus androsaceus JB14 TaxID=1447944 RepID=A0A6A4HWU4_9AGAR|nr:hypothetical protein BT96DRAFT_974860 [Gymnopus androsaceus JB14]
MTGDTLVWSKRYSKTVQSSINFKSRIEDFFSITSQTLSIVGEISEAVQSVPYLQDKGIKLSKEIIEYKDEWEKAKAALLKMESMIAEFHNDQKALKPSPLVQKALQQVINSLLSYSKYKMLHDVQKLQRVLQMNDLKNEAVSCVSSINEIHQYLQSYFPNKKVAAHVALTSLGDVKWEGGTILMVCGFKIKVVLVDDRNFGERERLREKERKRD